MNYQRIYNFRFQGIDQHRRNAVWREIAPYLYRRLGSPARVLDPAAGRGEFINAISAQERWAIDMTDMRAELDPAVRFIQSDVMAASLPKSYFDAVFVSNFLEHLSSPQSIFDFLTRMFEVLRPGGQIAIMGPNFRYCAAEYFDCADHILALTDVAVQEHLYAAGFEIAESHPQFLPYSFRQRLPPLPLLVRVYLEFPLAWRVFGKQFLVIGMKP